MPSVLRWTVQWVIIPPIPRFILLLFILTLTIVGSMQGFRLLQQTTFDFKAPAGSDAELADRVLFKYFPSVASEAAATTVVIKSLRHEQVVTENENVKAFEDAFESLLRYDFPDTLVYMSFRNLKRDGLDYLAEQLVNNASHATIQTIRLGLTRLQDDLDFRSFSDLVDDAIALLAYDAHLPRKDYFVASTGPAVFARDVRESTESDVLTIDGATFPVAMMTLALVLRSFRLLVLPVLCIYCVISISLLIMYELSQRELVKVTTLVPSIMMSSSVGFSIDYSLFLLSRFREEIRLGAEYESAERSTIVVTAVTRAFIYAGHTIVVSGMTLAFCWFVLVTFPVSIVSSVGIGAGITTTICVFVNLTLSPCLILTFPVFFSTDTSFFSLAQLAKLRKRTFRRLGRLFRLIFCCGWYDTSSLSAISPRATTRTTTNVIVPSLTATDDLSVGLLRGDESQQQQEIRPPSRPPIVLIESSSQVRSEMAFVEASARRTFKLARFVTSSKQKSLVIVSLVTLFLVPFAYFAWHYDHSDSFLLTIPSSAVGTKAFVLMEEEFGRGRLNPYSILVVPRSLSSPSNHQEILFRFIQERVIRKILLAPSESDVAAIQSVVWLFDRPIPHAEYRACQFIPSISHTCRTLYAVGLQTMSAKGPILLRVELGIEPNSVKGEAWLQRTRRALAELSEKSEYDFYIAQGASVSLDVVASVYEQFPRAIGFTASVVLVLDALAFQSIVVPVRALFSIAATLCFVYGSAVMVYQHGVLEWTGVQGLQSPTREIFWVSPIMLFGVLCGISLDYDTFTLTRIVEYHTVGFSDTDAVRAGLASSFKVVTTAGFIMSIAFCGLLFSDLPVLNQISFFLVTAVLFDTFVVRMFYVPSLMILLGKYNWFPRNQLAKFETQS